ncbi:MAG: RidA family protein [Bifidobacteriaceae bacterium]|jgi:reactive intermediate/imine deaminase|nr:RidA family protein [Bifidobacteriaceae bacterium]
MRRTVSSDSAAAPGGPYSPAVVSGGFAFISGCTPHKPGPAKELVTSSVRDQVVQAMENLKALAEAAGTNLSRAVRATVYLTSMDHFDTMNEVFAEYFGAAPPARTTVPVALRGFDVEIDAIVALPDLTDLTDLADLAELGALTSQPGASGVTGPANADRAGDTSRAADLSKSAEN